MRLDDPAIKQWAGKGLIYLATPYNHASSSVRQRRFEEACRIAASLMGQGLYIFCPIAHTHPIAQMGDLPKGWDFWQTYDRRMLWCCTELWIAEMEGWDRSEGIRGETAVAQELGIPVVYLEIDSR